MNCTTSFLYRPIQERKKKQRDIWVSTCQYHHSALYVIAMARWSSLAGLHWMIQCSWNDGCGQAMMIRNPLPTNNVYLSVYDVTWEVTCTITCWIT